MNEHIPNDDRTRLLEAARALVSQDNSKFSIAALCAQAGVERTVFRDWRRARAFLVQQLGLEEAQA